MLHTSNYLRARDRLPRAVYRYAGDMRTTSDSLGNVFTRLGDRGRDKRQGSVWLVDPPLSASEADAIYQHGIGARIVDRPAEDLTREGWRIAGPDGLEGLESAYQDLAVRSALSDLHRWGRRDGGAILGAAVDDGQRPADPLDMSRIRRVHGFAVVDRHSLTIIGPPHAPEGYSISADVPLEDRVVHPSRVLRFDGLPLPQRARSLRSGWGASAYEHVREAFRAYMTAHGYAEHIAHDASLDVIRLGGLAELASAKDADERLMRRMMTMLMGKDVLHGLVLDKDDEYSTMSKAAGPLPELIALFVEALVASTNMPRAILLGETPGGLNSGENAGEIRAWYDYIAAEQANRATRWVSWVTDIMLAAQDGPTGGRVPGEYTVEWEPLWQPSDKERAEVRLLNAQADVAYFQAGILDGEEIRHARFVEGLTGPIEVEAAALPDEPLGAPDDVDEPEETDGGAA